MGANMDIKRKAARGIAVLAVALAAGHLVQNMGDKPAPKPAETAGLAKKPEKVETVAAGPEAVGNLAAPKPAEVAPLPVAPLAATVTESLPKPEPVVKAPEPMPAAPKVVVEVRKAEPMPAKPAAVEPVASVAEQPDPCKITFDLMSEPNAMIGITLLAPCNPNQRVVLRQGGLAVTGQTNATGALFTSLPAFETDAVVQASFADGAKVEGQIAMPEMATLRRFGVQWQADDAFQIHAFENGATYGQPGHVSAADPHRPAPGLEANGGFLTLLGDSTGDNPLLAEVYTFPADPAAKPEVIVEAAVTDKTCGRELLAETLTSIGGSVFVTDLTLAMPECDAVGDYLVLKNLVLDLNMAAAN